MLYRFINLTDNKRFLDDDDDKVPTRTDYVEKR